MRHLSPRLPHAAADHSLGRAIRSRRRALDLRLADVAEATELSHSFLSQVENGGARPSVESLRRIAAALGTTPQALFSGDPTVEVSIVRRGDVPRNPVPGGRDEVVLYSHVGGTAPFHLLEFDGVVRSFTDYWVHAGFEAIVVMRGTIELDVAGELHTLNAGDSATYPADAPHRFRTKGRPRAAVILVESGYTDAAAHATPKRAR